MTRESAIAVVACTLLLSACSVTSRDALPEGAEEMKCVEGHDEWNQRGPVEEVEFVCDRWIRETP